MKIQEMINPEEMLAQTLLSNRDAELKDYIFQRNIPRTFVSGKVATVTLDLDAASAQSWQGMVCGTQSNLRRRSAQKIER